MKTVHCVSFFNGKCGIAKKLICLFGVLLFLSLGSAIAFAGRTNDLFGYPSSGRNNQSSYRTIFDSSAVSWYVKTHHFEGPYRVFAKHVYHFKGRWRQDWANNETNKNGHIDYEIEVNASFDPGAHPTSLIKGLLSEEVTFTSTQEFQSGQTFRDIMKFTTTGSSGSDPWLLWLFPTVSINTTCTLHQQILNNGADMASGFTPYNEDPPYLFSLWAFTQEERNALRQEEPVSLTCSVEQIRQKPTVTSPASGAVYNEYQDVVVALEMPCRPVEKEGDNLNRFNIVVERLRVEGGTGYKYWYEIYGMGSFDVPMTTNKYNYVTKGWKSLNLELFGNYRLKASQQGSTGEVDTGGPFTDWIYFTKRLPEIETLETESNIIGNKSVMVGQAEALQTGFAGQMTGKQIGDNEDMKGTSVLTSELVLLGSKAYNPRQIVTYALEGDLADKPTLEFSPDGRQWKKECPLGSSVRKLGEGTSVRFIAQGGAPGMYRLRYGKKTSDPFEVKAAVASASLQKTEKKTTRMMATNTKTPAPIKQPSIWFDLRAQPAPTPHVNQPFNLIIGLKNIGEAANGSSPSNKVVVRLSCQPLDGGNCDKLLGDPVVPAIPPGNSSNLSLTSVFKATRSGRYRVSMDLDPEPQDPTQAMMKMSNVKKSHSFEFNIIEREISTPKIPGTPATERPANKAPLKAAKPPGTMKKIQ